MSSFPKLAFMCPMPWTKMAGDEKKRFCSRCSKTVVNLSTMTEPERLALLAHSRPEDLCVAYYRRLQGGAVSAEDPLRESERAGVKQYGVAALSAAALVIVAAFAADKLAEKAAAPPANELTAQQSEKDNQTVMIMGMIVCPTDEAPKTEGDEPVTSDEVGGSATDAEKI